jgi:broad specificity phosphatase PhoE/predicted NUDIX family NTP pyrophosphohydrolase
MPNIRAAGTVPWRHRAGALEVALVHRPKYDDWSWTKGKLDADELWQVAAVRETLEETGLHVRLGMPLPPTAYRVLDRTGHPATKQVRYWAATVVGGVGSLENEIDEVVWLDVAGTHDRLDYAHDRQQLRAIQRADLSGTLDTWPLVVVRHGRAVPRSAYKGSRDWLRPLNAVGERQARALIPLLAAYGVSALYSSTSERCVATLVPYAQAIGREIQLRQQLSEESFARKGGHRVVKTMEHLLDAAEPVAICGHGPVLSTMIKPLLARVTTDGDLAVSARAAITGALDLNLEKGEAFVCHVSDAGADAKVVAVERIPT